MYTISNRRILAPSFINDELYIIIKGRRHIVQIPSKCWAALVHHLSLIIDMVDCLREGNYVEFSLNIGCAYYVSVNTGYPFIDIRRCYKTDEGILKPTRDGITLWIREFNVLCTIIPHIQLNNPSLSTVVQYAESGIHCDQSCCECNPYFIGRYMHKHTKYYCLACGEHHSS